MKYLNFESSACLLVFLGLASEVSASSWICQKGELTREVVVFYQSVLFQVKRECFAACIMGVKKYAELLRAEGSRTH